VDTKLYLSLYYLMKMTSTLAIIH